MRGEVNIALLNDLSFRCTFLDDDLPTDRLGPLRSHGRLSDHRLRSDSTAPCPVISALARSGRTHETRLPREEPSRGVSLKSPPALAREMGARLAPLLLDLPNPSALAAPSTLFFLPGMVRAGSTRRWAISSCLADL
jgi:hypothetical protein